MFPRVRTTPWAAVLQHPNGFTVHDGYEWCHKITQCCSCWCCSTNDGSTNTSTSTTTVTVNKTSLRNNLQTNPSIAKFFDGLPSMTNISPPNDAVNIKSPFSENLSIYEMTHTALRFLPANEDLSGPHKCNTTTTQLQYKNCFLVLQLYCTCADSCNTTLQYKFSTTCRKLAGYLQQL